MKSTLDFYYVNDKKEYDETTSYAMKTNPEMQPKKMVVRYDRSKPEVLWMLPISQVHRKTKK